MHAITGSIKNALKEKIVKMIKATHV
jgi:hypothetical protein